MLGEGAGQALENFLLWRQLNRKLKFTFVDCKPTVKMAGYKDNVLMIAISLTVHESPNIIMELISNIRYTYNRNAFLIVHISRDTKEKFLKHAAATGVNLHDADLYWNDIEMPTKWGNTLPMQVSNFLYLTMTLRRPFTHFQIITPANLIVGKNLDEYIGKHDIIINKPMQASNGWRWYESLQQDELYARFREQHGLGEPVAVRVDGMAVRADIFSGFVRRLLDIYSLDAMRNLAMPYPQEETFIPTYLARFSQYAYSIAPSFSRTFEPTQNPLTLEIVEKILSEDKVFYLKRISPQKNNPIRRMILEKRSFGVGDFPQNFSTPVQQPHETSSVEANQISQKINTEKSV
jgi:hypothetical protein